MTFDFDTLPRLQITLAEPSAKPEPETVPFKDVPVGARFRPADIEDHGFSCRKCRVGIALRGHDISENLILSEGPGWESERWEVDEAWQDGEPCVLLPDDDDPTHNPKPSEPEAVPFEDLPVGCVFRVSGLSPIYQKVAKGYYARPCADTVYSPWSGTHPRPPHWEERSCCIPLAILECLDPAVLEQGEGSEG